MCLLIFFDLIFSVEFFNGMQKSVCITYFVFDKVEFIYPIAIILFIVILFIYSFYYLSIFAIINCCIYLFIVALMYS